MRENKVKHFLKQLTIAVVVTVFFTISVQAERIETGDVATYNLGTSEIIHISLEHGKEKNGRTPVIISAGGYRPAAKPSLSK